MMIGEREAFRASAVVYRGLEDEGPRKWEFAIGERGLDFEMRKAVASSHI
jgi:hypothetical protein